MEQELTYPDIVLPRLRYRVCPMCATPLARGIVNNDGIPRVHCSNCRWIHYPTNALGVNVIVHAGNGIVAILPPGEPEDAPAALPSGHVEYGESPEQAAIREVREETGLDVEIVRCLGWYFEATSGYPGPILSFMFEVRAVGGHLEGSEEGRAAIYPLEELPSISPRRKGSRRTMETYLASRLGRK